MFNIQSRYVDAIAGFNFVEWKEDLALSISQNDLDRVVSNVAEKIIAASQLKPLFSSMAERELSLRDACYLCAQDTDRKDNQDTPAKIVNAPEEAKEIISYAAEKLSKDFVNVNSDDLNVLTLLFGIHRITELAQGVIITPPLSKLEQAEKDLNRLKVLKEEAFTPLNQVAPESQIILDQVNQKITEATELLSTLQINTQESQNIK